VWDHGLCTAEHLRLFDGLGAKLKKTMGRGENPLHAMGCWAIDEPALKPRVKAMLKFWLAKGYDINAERADGLSPLWMALESHVRALQKHIGLCRRYKSWEPPDKMGHDDVAMMLLEGGARPDAVHARGIRGYIPVGASPLMVQRYDDDRLVKAMLKHGANVKAKCAQGKTALQYAREAAKNPKRHDCKGAARVAALLEAAMTGSGKAGGK
jgi:hypothetical protein